MKKQLISTCCCLASEVILHFQGIIFTKGATFIYFLKIFHGLRFFGGLRLLFFEKVPRATLIWRATTIWQVRVIPFGVSNFECILDTLKELMSIPFVNTKRRITCTKGLYQISEYHFHQNS